MVAFGVAWENHDILTSTWQLILKQNQVHGAWAPCSAITFHKTDMRTATIILSTRVLPWKNRQLSKSIICEIQRNPNVKFIRTSLLHSIIPWSVPTWPARKYLSEPQWHTHHHHHLSSSPLLNQGLTVLPRLVLASWAQVISASRVLGLQVCVPPSPALYL